MPKPRTPVRTVAERNRLIEMHIRLVYWGAKKFRIIYPDTSKMLTHEDRVDICLLALIRALELWEPGKGTISTYAFTWMRFRLRRHVAHMARDKTLAAEAAGERGKRRRSSVTAADARMDVEDMLHFLMPKERQVIECRLQGMTLEEAGECLGLPRQRVHVLEQDAYARLRRAFGTHY